MFGAFIGDHEQTLRYGTILYQTRHTSVNMFGFEYHKDQST